MISVRTKTSTGSTLVEVVVAIAIAATAIVGLTNLFITGFDAYNLSRGYTNGVYLAQEKIEDVASYRQIPVPAKPEIKNSAIINPQSSIGNMGTEVLQDINYRWERKYYDEKDKVPAGFVQVEVLVNWSDPHGDHKVSLVTLKPK